MLKDGIRNRKEDVVFELWTKELKEELSNFWDNFNK